MKERLQNLLNEADELITGACDEKALSEARTRILGRKGELTSILRSLKDLPADERSAVGQLANRIKADLEARFDKAEAALNERIERQKLASEFVDVTLPGRRFIPGRTHILNRVANELIEVFNGLGFQLAEGPEVELDYYNFEALNIPRDHPARDMQDTFYFSENVVLRTHTSPVQIRTMEKQKPPVRVICPGKVYRRDADITHSPMFMQIEGLWVDKGVSFADLKGVLTAFVHVYFGEQVGLRFRPSFFPFTEPSAEVDIQCVICGGTGCRTCSQTGWLEILGSGMVDPELYSFVNYDPEIYTGYAFGLGIERVAMLKYGIPDIRAFYENDMRFLTQF
ncbi:MAG: phenylalanine--tRNA ligase subunit alpha [Desulfomonile tiedjei]|uniref:Phenylalanine--tRNA ligase alpha subunit n=1 Tax=Desulfomonile tiedjei TaxID=2358 RepID=A0A9D6V9B5_9BACT|nr:phenylalanine--tRNA ligase subunit alpha [Desulfomonile tiedjei]